LKIGFSTKAFQKIDLAPKEDDSFLAELIAGEYLPRNLLPRLIAFFEKEFVDTGKFF
jgi:hypothetical protein